MLEVETGLQAMEQRIIQSIANSSAVPPTAVRLPNPWSDKRVTNRCIRVLSLPFVDGALSDNEGPIDHVDLRGMDMTMVMRRMLSPTIATELALDYDVLARARSMSAAVVTNLLVKVVDGLSFQKTNPITRKRFTFMQNDWLRGSAKKAEEGL